MSRRLLVTLLATAALAGCPKPEPEPDDPATPCRRYVDAANACYAAQGSTTTLGADATCAAADALSGADADASNELFECTAAAYESADCSSASGVSDVAEGVALCSGDTGSQYDTWDTGYNPCSNYFSTFPESGETQAYFRTSIEARLQVADPAAFLSLTDALGVAVPGVSTVSDRSVTFLPSAPLQPNTAYIATLTYACGDADWSFTVGDVGAPVSGALDGRAYALDLASGRFVRPEGMGALIGQFLTTQVLLGVAASTADTLDMIGATAVAESNPPREDPCVPTVAFPTADFTQDPYFLIDGVGTRVPLNIAGYVVPLDDLVLSGAFSPDASYLAGVRLDGSLDTYSLAEILDATCVEGSDHYPDCQNAMCELAAGIGDSCVACSDGSGDHCLDLEVDSVVGEGIAGPLIARTQTEIDADSACPTP